jgi:hypothetical protein
MRSGLLVTVGPGVREPEPQALVVMAAAGDARRAVGAIAWAVLEELALAAACTDYGRVAHLSARGLALRLAIDKDTATRALRRLAVAGIIDRLDQDHASAGRFGTGGYRLCLPDGLVIAPCPGIGDTAGHLAGLAVSSMQRPTDADTAAGLKAQESIAGSDSEPTAIAASTGRGGAHQEDSDRRCPGSTPREPQLIVDATRPRGSARRTRRSRPVAGTQPSLFDATFTTDDGHTDTARPRDVGRP